MVAVDGGASIGRASAAPHPAAQAAGLLGRLDVEVGHGRQPPSRVRRAAERSPRAKAAETSTL